MPLSDLTERTEVLSGLWADLAAAYEAEQSPSAGPYVGSPKGPRTRSASATSRHDVLQMSQEQPEVTRNDVERLWADAIAQRYPAEETSRRAQALIELANSETPIVNWGLLSLYYLWQPEVRRDSASLVQSRERWRAQLREYDADPPGWMRRYFEQMLARHAERCGHEAGRTFGRHLVRDGYLNASEVARVLDDRP
jgi:hypothetical protein